MLCRIKLTLTGEDPQAWVLIDPPIFELEFVDGADCCSTATDLAGEAANVLKKRWECDDAGRATAHAVGFMLAAAARLNEPRETNAPASGSAAADVDALAHEAHQSSLLSPAVAGLIKGPLCKALRTGEPVSESVIQPLLVEYMRLMPLWRAPRC